MTDYQQQLFGNQSFLSATLDSAAQGRSNSVRLPDDVVAELWDRGVLSFRPLDQRSADSILLSVGVHGDETAPIEIIDQLVSDIFSGKLWVKHNLLIVMANPDAMNANCRQVDENMNRLFNNDFNSTVEDSPERRRCIGLMNHSRDFFNRATAGKFHYDLHTTIRDSRCEKFAMSPNVSSSSQFKEQCSMLGQWGVEAMVKTNKQSATYSAFTAQHLGAISFTLELGKARPFGENDLATLSGVISGLNRLVSGNTQAPPVTKMPKFFTVAAEIIKHSHRFQLCFASTTANFTEFTVGEQLAVDGNHGYTVAVDGERILFPNENVAIGQRALVVIRPDNTTKAENHE